MKKIRSHEYFKIAAFHFGIALIALLGQVIANGGLYTLTADYNEQQIPFAMLMNDAFKTGNVMWNWNIDLGSDFFGAMSYYALGSPFFWITLLFPKNMYVYVAVWIFMLKYAIAGVTSYAYLKRFVKNKKYALLGSMLYSFSGFQSINLIFASFHDAVAFFPLLLIGIEKLTEENKKGFLAFAVALNALANYYLFSQEVIFAVLYFICRKGIWGKKTWKQIGKCFTEGIMGVGMAAVLLIPALTMTLSNPRVGNLLAKESWINTSRRYLLQLWRVFLYPGEIMCRQSCIREENFSSWSAYLPLVGIALVFCYLFKRKWDWLSRILAIGFLFAAIPLLNSIFGLFAESNYHRWYFMLILIMALASARVMEDRQNYKIRSVAGGLLVLMLLMVVVFFWWDKTKFQLIYVQETYAVLTGIAILGMLITFLAAFWKKDERYYKTMLFAIAAGSIFTTAYTSFLYQQHFPESSQDYYTRLMAYQEFTCPDESYRFATQENTITMTVPLSGTGSFNSTVSGSVFSFWESLGEKRMVFSPEATKETDALLSAKYEIQELKDDSKTLLQTVQTDNRTYYLYERVSVLPIGFTYHTYMIKSEFDKIAPEKRARVMLKTLIIPDNKEKDVVGYLSQEKAETVHLESTEALVASHQKEASIVFEKGTSQFRSILPTEKKGYAFFSIPYEKGWSAKVNGTAEKIVNVNGLMAVPVEEGENTIMFRYTNYNLIAGALISIIFIGFFVGYCKNKRFWRL